MASGVNLVVSSRENKTYKLLRQLTQKKFRQELGLVIIEDTNAPSYVKNVVEIIVREDKVKEYEKKVLHLGAKISIFALELFKSVSTLENSHGLIFIVKVPMEKKITHAKIFVLDEIQDPGNMGTIIRTLDALNFTQVILIKGCVDIWNEKCVRGAMGSLFHVDIHSYERAKAIEFLQKEGYHIYATTLSERSISHFTLKLAEKCAFVMGNEGQGVSESFLDVANTHVKIVMYGKAESLNVGVATAVLGYEVRRCLL